FERPEANPNRRTVKLYVAGPQAAFAAAADKCRDIWPDSPAAAQMTCLETVSPVDQADLVTAPADLEKDTFDVTLFVMPRRDDEEFPFRHFCAFAAEAGYEVKEDYRICSGGLLSVPVYGPRAGLAHLARFVFVRQIEEVARLRPFETPLPPGPRPD
ncbi:MAG: hypothetical protein LBP33_06185, partial [Candidatus Adiutrix sp.]|nr:hypothetical protein [Candidatus Adiutrix sp.]